MQGHFSSRLIGWLGVIVMGAPMVGCDATPVAPPTEAASALVGFPDEVETDPARVGRLMARSCAFCHVDGNAGAPIIGDAAEWGARLAKGREVLLTNTLEGVGDMPPLGYCMACTASDFEALIDLMLGDAVAVDSTEEGG